MPRDIEQKASYFGFLVNPKMSSVFLYHYLKRNGTRLNGTERTGSESKTTQLCWNINDQVFNQSVFVCMIFNDKHEALHVEFCLVTWDKKHRIFGSLASP